jgi:hypothetical protein
MSSERHMAMNSELKSSQSPLPSFKARTAPLMGIGFWLDSMLVRTQSNSASTCSQAVALPSMVSLASFLILALVLSI